MIWSHAHSILWKSYEWIVCLWTVSNSESFMPISLISEICEVRRSVRIDGSPHPECCTVPLQSHCPICRSAGQQCKNPRLNIAQLHWELSSVFGCQQIGWLAWAENSNTSDCWNILSLMTGIHVTSRHQTPQNVPEMGIASIYMRFVGGTTKLGSQEVHQLPPASRPENSSAATPLTADTWCVLRHTEEWKSTALHVRHCATTCSHFCKAYSISLNGKQAHWRLRAHEEV